MVLCRHIGTMSQQQLTYGLVAMCSSKVQCCVAIVVLCPDIGTMLVATAVQAWPGGHI